MRIVLEPGLWNNACMKKQLRNSIQSVKDKMVLAQSKNDTKQYNLLKKVLCRLESKIDNGKKRKIKWVLKRDSLF